nr:alpha-amylase [Oryza sativa Indica Group]
MVANKHFLSLSVLIVLLGLSSNLAAGQVLFQGFNWESWKENGGWYNLLMGKLGGRHRGRHHPRLAPSRPTLSASKATSGRLYDLTRPIIEAFHGKGVQRDRRQVVIKAHGEHKDGRASLRLPPRLGPAHDLPRRPLRRRHRKPDTAAHRPPQQARPRSSSAGSTGSRWTSASTRGLDFAKATPPTCKDLHRCHRAELRRGRDMDVDGERGDGKRNYDQNAHRQELVNWVNRVGGQQQCHGVRLHHQGHPQRAVEGDRAVAPRRGRKAPGMIGWWPAKADLRRQPRHRLDAAPVAVSLRQGYAYILTHPGNPCIFYDHFFDWGLKDEIECLVSIRNRQGIHPAQGPGCWLLRVEKGRCSQRWKPREGNLRMCPCAGVFRAACLL